MRVTRDDLDLASESLEAEGYTTRDANLCDDVDRINDAIVVHRPTVVLNLVDHMWGDTAMPAAVAAILDLYGYTYCGNGHLALASCLERARTHALLASADLPVVPHGVAREINAIPELEELGYPQIVSQALDDIYDDPDNRKLLDSQEEVNACIQELTLEFEFPFLIERYLEGTRVQAWVLGHRVLEVLPLVEVESHAAPGSASIAQLDADTAGFLRELAKRAFRALSLRDFAQIDFVISDDLSVHIIDVRPAPDLFGPALQCAASQREYGLSGLIGDLVRLAHARLPKAELAQYPLPERQR
jgi:D-alanine-D-alanine ligase